MNTSLIAMDPSPDSEETFRRLKEDSKEHLRMFRILDVDWPDAVDVVKELCVLISDSICTSDGKPVLFLAVQKGLHAYSDNILADDIERFRIFLTTVLEVLGELLCSLVVLNTQLNKTWRPDDCEPFLEWWGVTTIENIRLVEGKCTKDCIIESLKSALLVPQELNVLEISYGSPE